MKKRTFVLANLCIIAGASVLACASHADDPTATNEGQLVASEEANTTATKCTCTVPRYSSYSDSFARGDATCMTSITGTTVMVDLAPDTKCGDLSGTRTYPVNYIDSGNVCRQGKVYLRNCS